jgi:hypothetical protein
VDAIELHQFKAFVERNSGNVTFVNTDFVECKFNDDQELDLSNYV